MWPELQGEKNTLFKLSQSPSFQFQKSREADHPLENSILQREWSLQDCVLVRAPFYFLRIVAHSGGFTWMWISEWHGRPGVNQESLSSCPGVRPSRWSPLRLNPPVTLSGCSGGMENTGLDKYASGISSNTPQNQSHPNRRGFHCPRRPTCGVGGGPRPWQREPKHRMWSRIEGRGLGVCVCV